MPPCASRQVRGSASERTSHGYFSILPIYSPLPRIPPLPPVLISFLPDHGNNFVKSTRRRRNDEGGTTALRGDCILPSSRVLTLYTPSLAQAFSLSLAREPSSASPFHPRRYRGARARCVLLLCPPRARSLRPLSVRLTFSLPLPSFFTLSRARSISYSFLLRVPLNSLATFALVRPPHRRVRTRGTRISVCSHARTLARSQPSSSSSSSSGRLRIRAAGVSRGTRGGKGTPEDASLSFRREGIPREPARITAN